MAFIYITEKEASMIYALTSEVEPEDAVVLDKLYRKMSASLTNKNLKNTAVFAGTKKLSYKDVPGPISKD